MTPETAAALEASIEKWKRNAQVDRFADATLGIRNCPLCRLHYLSDCNGCPVAARTGVTECQNTPYCVAICAKDNDYLPAFRAAALEEAAFLESLREPKEETP